MYIHTYTTSSTTTTTTTKTHTTGEGGYWGATIQTHNHGVGMPRDAGPYIHFLHTRHTKINCEVRLVQIEASETRGPCASWAYIVAQAGCQLLFWLWLKDKDKRALWASATCFSLARYQTWDKNQVNLQTRKWCTPDFCGHTPRHTKVVTITNSELHLCRKNMPPN